MIGHRHRGFSLLEVIAAILILGIAFGALLRVGASSLNLTARSTEYTQAALWASSLLDKLYIVDFPRPGQSEGKFNDRFRWHLNVIPTQDEDEQVRIYQIALDVSWGDKPRVYTEHFETLRVVPNVKAPPPDVPL
ncbi:type II secretion system protein [Dyella sp. GSA-30]|uniref:type IV pilus modification PilV family protein n=1 Tax=Dyella sp. GSA-30 TaxID=2994496 RepID=UPI0024909654|nr:type II secretion system protein [Dyella sp. GSA-30]BDU21031.1 hypothetical protein DYGSA30_24880 [Dyella sp. GSA-30]